MIAESTQEKTRANSIQQGHFGVIFAKALGADKVVGISRKADKKDDVLKMGADEYIATSDDKDVS